MSEKDLELVRQFFGEVSPERAHAGARSCFAEDVSYDVFIAQAPPLASTFQGRRAVETYHAIAKYTYQILLSEPTTYFVDANKVIARGSEIARVVRENQTVRAEWIAVFEIKGDLISKISMSIYRWTPISRPGLASVNTSRPAVRAQG